MPEQKRKRVLIVDDMENWRNLLSDILSPTYDVIVCAGFDEAREAIASQVPPFHVAILDIRLVEEDTENREGMGLAELLKAGEDYTRVIMLTAYPSKDTNTRAFNEYSVFKYMEKVPGYGEEEFSEEEFLKIVNQAAQEATKLKAKQYAKKGIDVLLVEGDEAVRKQISKMLGQINYNVDTVSGAVEKIKAKIASKRYDLFVLHAELLASEPDISDLIYKYRPDAKIILIKNGHIDTITESIREGQVHKTAKLDGSESSYKEFGRKIRTIMAPGVNKYLCARFENETFNAGEQNRLILTLENRRKENAAALIPLSPFWIKQGKISLRLAFQSSGISIPMKEITWQIPDIKENIPPLEILIIPKMSGTQSITITINHEENRICRIEIENDMFRFDPVKNRHKIFLCYSSSEEEKIAEIYERLKQEGFNPWMDQNDILPGEDWEYTIEESMRKSDFFLIFLNLDSIDHRGFFNREIDIALEIEKEKQQRDICIIPVRMEECKVPPRLRRFQWLNLYERDGWKLLVKALNKGMERYKI
jgi:DNA-binding response OmpR family regulator